MKQRTTEETALYTIGLSLMGLGLLLWLIMNVLPVSLDKYILPCLFHSLTGYYCPGCGGTRAVITFAQGKWLQSFIYHPVVLYGAVIGGWFMVSQTMERVLRKRWKIGMKYHDGYLWIALGIVILNFLLKNIALFLGYDFMKGFV